MKIEYTCITVLNRLKTTGILNKVTSLWKGKTVKKNKSTTLLTSVAKLQLV